ncbi:MAG TPA: PEGA domain-containing protein, partial [Polyangiales bacterium]|nr:PEGA domain-containing protein [Polyangiales bacterium]
MKRLTRLVSCLAVTLALGTVSHSAHAAAPKLAVLSPKIEEGADPNTEWQIIATIAGQLADEGFDVQVPREINLKLAPELRACNAVECAKGVKKTLGVDYVLAVKVFHMGSGDSLSIALIDAADGAYSGRADITATTSANQAAAQALWQALDAQRRGPGPWVLVQGEPTGANVLVNGKDVGKLPRAQCTVHAGENEIEVKAEGYEPFHDKRTFSTDVDEMQ